jgi:hypothetical protein
MRCRWLLLACLLGAPLEADADEAGRARFHAKRGQDFYLKGRYEEAAREYFALRRLSDSPQVLFNLALCFDALDEADQAFFYFASFVDGDGISEDNRRYAQAALQRLRSRVAQVRVLSEPLGADVYIDKREYGSYGQTPLVVPVKAGRRQLWLEKAGFRATSLQVRAQRGKEVEARAELTAILGRLLHTSRPPGEVLVTDPDGSTAAQGQSPLEVALAPGVYVVETSAPGHQTNKSLVKIEPDQTTEQEVELRALPPPKGAITVTANPPGSLVEVDGEPVGFAPAVLSDLDLGVRQFRISHDDVQSWEGEVDVRPEERGYLTATLQPPPRKERSVATWIAGGIGGAALGAALVTGILTLDTQSRFDDAVERQSPEAQGLRDQGVTLATTTDVLLVVGAVGVATGVLLYFLTERTDARASEASLSWGVQ